MNADRKTYSETRPLVTKEGTVMVTREEFDRLLDDYVTAYGAAILVSTRAGTAYPDALERAAEARQALGKAVFP